ncbi:MAG: fasciclin domain-containing protein [Ekhidna sp.]|nr:fasciclin domain-containing protein [Ekhidna sp.]
MKKSYLKFFRAFTLVGIMASFLAFTSCSDDDEPDPGDTGDDPGDMVDPTQSILELVVATDGLDSLEKYLSVYPDLTALLGGEGTFTVFAPTNDAFIGLLQTPGFPANIASINPDIIKGVLSYHVVAGQEVAQADFATDLTLSTAFTDPVAGQQSIAFNADGTLLTGSTNATISVITADIAATNGIVHTVESVMIPPSVGATLTPILGTLAGTVLLGADFSILAQGIAKADEGKATAETIAGALASVTDLTVFAPTNATFENAQITADSFDGATWDAIIRNHVVVGQGGATMNDNDDTVGPGDLTTGSTFQTLAGGSLLIFNDTETIAPMNGIGIYIDSNGDVDLSDPTSLGNFDAEVAAPDVVNISQGRIHVIAGFLTPTPPAN